MCLKRDKKDKWSLWKELKHKKSKIHPKIKSIFIDFALNCSNIRLFHLKSDYFSYKWTISIVL